MRNFFLWRKMLKIVENFEGCGILGKNIKFNNQKKNNFANDNLNYFLEELKC